MFVSFLNLDHPDTYFPYETYGEAVMECVYLMSSQREHVLAAETELLKNYGVSEDYKARKLLELFRSTEELINQTFDGLCVRLQGELKPRNYKIRKLISFIERRKIFLQSRG